jgi:hypothetical protein
MAPRSSRFGALAAERVILVCSFPGCLQPLRVPDLRRPNPSLLEVCVVGIDRENLAIRRIIAPTPVFLLIVTGIFPDCNKKHSV